MQLQGSGQTPAIAVPSRLRSRGSLPGGSLRGIRITVKDIFDIAGLKTGLGSRAYTELYGPAINTAPSIQKLLNAGAELVSMSKMCSMVLKASPTQCVDVSAPFNPRGDGYLSPSGGSSGQAAAVATYPWLDFAIGSDCELSKSDSRRRISYLNFVSSYFQWANASPGEWMLFTASHITRS